MAPLCKLFTRRSRELRTNLRQLLDDVADRRDHALVTRNGRPAAALVPIDDARTRVERCALMRLLPRGCNAE